MVIFVVYVTSFFIDECVITLIQYHASDYKFHEGLDLSEAAQLISPEYINWIDIEVTDQQIVEQLQHYFKIHPLIGEDILNTGQLPKFEVFEDHLYFNTKMLSLIDDSEIYVEHLSIVMQGQVLITCQEGLPGDAFDELRNRIRLSKGVVRKHGVDFLFYHILDAVAVQYLTLMERFRLRIDELEGRLVNEPGYDVTPDVIATKRNINILRKYILPMKDALGKLKVEAKGFISKSSVNYFQDVLDHLIYLMISFDSYREMLKDLLDLHNSNQNNERNRVMKTLTVVSAIFIPLTFLAGVYGMNFKYMPELESEIGYPVVLSAMGFVALCMSLYMWLKKWF